MALQDNAYIAQNIHPLWTNLEFDRILREMIDGGRGVDHRTYR